MHHRKKRYMRGKRSTFMNKTFPNAIMLRSKLRKIFLKTELRKKGMVIQNKKFMCYTMDGYTYAKK